jgi:hypothetical protein
VIFLIYGTLSLGDSVEKDKLECFHGNASDGVLGENYCAQCLPPTLSNLGMNNSLFTVEVLDSTFDD